MAGQTILGRIALFAIVGSVVSVTSPRFADADPITLIRLGGKSPCFVSIEIALDRLPLGDSRSEQLKQLFDQLDSDSGGSLDQKELQDLTRRGNPTFTPADREGWWKPGDKSPEDGKISAEEFRSLEETILGFPVQLRFLPQRQSQVFDLIGKLDRNRDRNASFQEIREGNRSLDKFDLNEDGSVAVEELVPPGTTPEMMNSGSSVERSWLLLTKSDPRDAADRLIGEFDRLPEGKPDRLLSSEESGFGEDQIAKFDRDGNRLLDAIELEKLLADPPIDVRGKLQIRSNSFRRPKLELQAIDRGIELTTSDNVNSTRIDGVRVDWSSRGTTITGDDARRFFRQRFIQADVDKNGYLGEQEFATLGIPGGTFGVVDRDRDGKLFDPELLSYLRLQILLTQGRITLICADETRSLLELLDKDSDRRLSAREFHEAEEKLRPVDQNRDGAISPAELAEMQSVVVEYNRSPLLELAARSANQPPLRSVTRQILSGPIWFQNMDRNRDGFVTKREFLGPIDVFARLDGNRDAAIDESEAGNAIAQ